MVKLVQALAASKRVTLEVLLRMKVAPDQNLQSQLQLR